MSTTQFLQAVKRRPSVIAPILIQGVILVLLYIDRSNAAAVVGLFGVAWLAVLRAMADDRQASIQAECDAATTRIAELEAELAAANADPVTGLPVRRLAERHIGSAVDVDLTVAVVDVDDMHGINNSRGHLFGDAYLAGVADRLYTLASDGDMVARLGGDEFVFITTRTPHALAHVLTAAVREPVTIAGAQLPMRLSVGLCRLPGGDAHTALGCADLAMFTAKRRRSGIEHYDPARDGTPQPPGVRPGIRHRGRRTTGGTS